MPRNPEVNFYLKPVDKEGKALIYLNFKYNNNRLFFSFGERINPNDWDEKKQLAKNKKSSIFTSDGKNCLNELIRNLKEKCIEAYQREKINGIPKPDVLRKNLNGYLLKEFGNKKDNESELFKLINRFIKGEIKNRGKDKSPATIQTYKTTLKHLLEFEKFDNSKIDFESITLDFYYKFTDYLKDQGHGRNNIGKQIKTLKVFMGEAVDLGLTTNMQFKNKKFFKDEEETEGVYLTESEIECLYKHDFSSNKRLEQVRDLFVFGCWVGLRFSDFSSVREDNIVELDGDLFIKMVTKKTGESVFIPTHPIVLDIFKKYKDNPNKLPKAISNQKFNEYIKEACKEAGMNQKGRLFKTPSKELWESIESRTARRSFATNLYLSGYQTHEIMKVTGHRTEKAFMTYIKASKLDSAKRMNAYFKKKWSEKIYKIEAGY